MHQPQNKLRSVKDNVEPLHKTSFRNNRREEVFLCRLCIGNSVLTHSYLLSRTSPSLCPVCSTQLTVNHILLEYPKYASYRQILLSESLSDFLANSESTIQLLFRYLVLTNLHRITQSPTRKCFQPKLLYMARRKRIRREKSVCV